MAQPSKCTHGIDLDQDCRDCEMESDERHKNHKAPVNEEELYEELDDVEDEDEDFDEDEYDLGEEDDFDDDEPLEHPDTGEHKH